EDPQLDTRDLWMRAMIGHAVSNVVPIAAANRVGNEGGQIFYGSSFIADHRGERLAELGRNETGVIPASFDLDQIRRDRALLRFLPPPAPRAPPRAAPPRGRRGPAGPHEPTLAQAVGALPTAALTRNGGDSWMSVFRMTNRRWLAVWTAIGVTIAWHCWSASFNHDEIEHLHAAWLISIGQLPFRDFLEHHHPTLWFLAPPLT